FPSGSGGVTSAPFASVTPGPPVPPTGVPALTPIPPEPSPTLEPVPTLAPLPTLGPLPTYPPVPTWPPLPTLVPRIDPTLPPKACVHPGTHLGVDACRWPHNP